MISSSKITLSQNNLNNFKILRPKVTKNLTNLRKKFCESPPRSLNKIRKSNIIWEKLNIAPSRIFTTGSIENIGSFCKENLGSFCKKSTLINKLDFLRDRTFPYFASFPQLSIIFRNQGGNSQNFLRKFFIVS